MIVTDFTKKALSFRKEIVKMKKQGWKAISLYSHQHIEWNEKVIDMKLNKEGDYIFVKIEKRKS